MPALKRAKLEHDFGKQRAELGLDKEFFVNDQRGLVSSWSCQNVLAVATLDPSDIFEDATQTPRISMTHFCPTRASNLGSPSSTKGFTPSGKKRKSWSLSLPESKTPFDIVGLDFSPDGRHLLVTTGTLDNDALTVFEQGETINEWSIIWSEDMKNVGIRQAKTIVKTTWLDGASSRWIDDDRPSLVRKSPRHAAVRGQGFLAVLSTCELLVALVPPARPLLPLLAVVKLYPEGAETIESQAIPTPSLIHGAQNAVDSLVSSLVAGAQSTATTATNGAQAMRDQLEAAKTAEESEELRIVEVADIAFPRVKDPLKGDIQVLVASSFLPPVYEAVKVDPLTEAQAKQSSQQEQRPKSSAGYDEKPFDFTDIDAAFPSAAPSPEPEDTKPGIQHDNDDDIDMQAENTFARVTKVSMTLVTLKMLAREGPRVCVSRMPSLFPADTLSGVHPLVQVTGLAFTGSSLTEEPNANEEQGIQDLSLAVALSIERSSWINKYEILFEPYQLSKVILNHANKPGLPPNGPAQWTYTRTANIPCGEPSGYVVSLNRLGYRGISYLQHLEDGSTSVCLLKSDLSRRGVVKLPAGIYSQMSWSANEALACVVRTFQEPVVVANPDANHARMLATALLEGRDVSDIVGIVPHEQVVSTLRDAQALVARAIAPKRFEQSSLHLDVMGAAAFAFQPHPSLSPKRDLMLDLLELAASRKTFQTCRTRQRALPSSDSSTTVEHFQCEADAVWPLIGHAGWYVRFVAALVSDLAHPSTPDASDDDLRWLALTETEPRSNMASLASAILGMQAFLANLFTSSASTAAAASGNNGAVAASTGAGASATVEVALDVLTDITTSGPVNLAAFQTFLDKLEKAFPTGGDSASALLGLAPPVDRVRKTRELLKDDIASVLLDASMSSNGQTRPGSERTMTGARNELDIMRKAVLPPHGAFKECTRCSHRVLRSNASSSAPKSAPSPLLSFGKWSSIELLWRNACYCGGLWYAVDK